MQGWLQLGGIEDATPQVIGWRRTLSREVAPAMKNQEKRI
jgi:hypothetical protein